MNVILSIKPIYADAIFSGQKKVEFRKSLFKKEVDKVFVYSCIPVKKIIGYFTVSSIIEKSPQELWQQFGEVGCIDERDFFDYFQNKPTGYAIGIGVVKGFEEIVDPYHLIKGFVPPQSFRYYHGDMNEIS